MEEPIGEAGETGPGKKLREEPIGEAGETGPGEKLSCNQSRISALTTVEETDWDTLTEFQESITCPVRDPHLSGSFFFSHCFHSTCQSSYLNRFRGIRE